jgi:hypothetical protein
MDIVSLIRVRRLNWIGHINWIDNTSKVEQIFGSQPAGVRTRGRSRCGCWECVWTDIEKGGITDWRETSGNRYEYKKAIEESNVHFGQQGELRGIESRRGVRRNTLRAEKQFEMLQYPACRLI